MAIFHDVPGLKVEVVVDGEPLQEYDDDDDAEPGIVTKYIEALSDKEFALRYTFDMATPVNYGVQARINIDGDRCGVVHTAKHMHERHHRYGPGHFKDGQHFRQNYRFTALNIVEEHDGTASAKDIRKDMESKGSIYLEFRFIKNLRSAPRGENRGPKRSLKEMGAIPEKALKGDARSHQVTLSKARPCVRGGLYNYDYVDGKAFAKIRFSYRSRAALKALRIISNDEDENLERDDDVPENHMTSEQLREALRRARRRENDRRRVKQESVARNMKRERAQTIELPDDDDELTIVESRTRKRPRGEPEVIVLD